MNESENNPFLDREFQTRFEKLMMVSITDRYALLYRVGFDHQTIAALDLTSAPLGCVNELFRLFARTAGIDKYKNLADKLKDAVMMAKLPEGIPE